MKTLIIFRHGKSAWDNPDLVDFDRPLNERGKKNTKEMGLFILKKSGKPEMILSSAAKRAVDTAKIAAENMNYAVQGIKVDANLYHASVHAILKSVAEIPNDISHCMLVGHNPGLTNLINYFGFQLYNLPTASAVCFNFNTEKWHEISPDASFQWLQLAKEL